MQFLGGDPHLGPESQFLTVHKACRRVHQHGRSVNLGYEAVGELDSRSSTVERWDEPNRKGVIAYVDGESRPRGILLWDTWGKVDEARALIEAGQPVDAGDLFG